MTCQRIRLPSNSAPSSSSAMRFALQSVMNYFARALHGAASYLEHAAAAVGEDAATREDLHEEHPADPEYKDEDNLPKAVLDGSPPTSPPSDHKISGAMADTSKAASAHGSGSTQPTQSSQEHEDDLKPKLEHCCVVCGKGDKLKRCTKCLVRVSIACHRTCRSSPHHNLSFCARFDTGSFRAPYIAHHSTKSRLALQTEESRMSGLMTPLAGLAIA